MIRYSDDFLSKYRRTTKAHTPILYFLSWEDGKLDYQGYLFRLNADGTGRAQLFSWLMGDPSEEITFTRAFLEECTFYTTNIEMRSAAEEQSARERRAERQAGAA